jgi:hypothetical protein
MEAATRKGAASVRKLNPLIVLVWLSKILYGLLYREHLLSFDRKIPFKGRLVRRTFLKSLKTFYLFLQAARVTVQFAGSFPASIFVFSLQLPLNAKAHFDFQDSPLFLTVACRIGKVGIIAALQDGGSQHQLFQRYMARFQKVRLHPIQFNELVSKVFYKASLMNRTPRYLTAGQADGYVVYQLPLQGLSMKPIYDPWNWEYYARDFSPRTGQSFSHIYKPPDQLLTFLTDQKDRILRWNVKNDQWILGERTEVQTQLKRVMKRPLR